MSPIAWRSLVQIQAMPLPIVGTPPGVQDEPYSLEIAGSNPSYATAHCGWEFLGGNAQLARRSPGRVERFSAWCLVPRHLGLGACTSTLGASVLGASVLGVQCTHLNAQCFDAQRSVPRRSALGARTSSLRRSMRGARILDCRLFGARCLAPRRLVHALQRSKLRHSTLWCSTLGAWRNPSTLWRSGCLRMSGFHRCVTCEAKLPANDPHEDCVACLGPEHAASALADRSFCALCANFQQRTLRQRARKAVGRHSPSSGSSHTLSAPPLSTVTPPIRLQISRSPSQLTAGQRSPDHRRARERTRSPSIQLRGPSSRRECSCQSRSRSVSPRRRGCSCSPRRDRRYREKSGVAELTSKMSQFMDVMMGQQSLLMSLANMAPRATDVLVGLIANQPAFPPQPLSAPVVQQPQGVWDVDAISRESSEGEPLLEEDSVEAELTSQHSEQDTELEVLDTTDPLWSLVERATRHLGIEWPAIELPQRSLFESPSVQSPQPRMLPAFPDFIKEVQSTWGAPASSPATSRKASAFAMQGVSDAGLASFPPVDAAFAALVRTQTLSGLAKDPACPNRQCRTTEIHLKKGYSAATEAVRLSNVASLLSVYQAALVKDLPEHPSLSLRAELALVAQLLVNPFRSIY
ncbi:UNVERIFIED_CONTAM: hypothetical protein FKN15_055409 [Acipenser sinensis]